MLNEIKLGLCRPPKPIYLYVKNGECEGTSYLWYQYDIEKEKTIPVHLNGLTGYISELRVTAKEFKGKENHKLDIVISADELYVVRTGIETNFAKTFLLSASVVQNFSQPLIITTAAGDENTVFCRLYDAQNKTRFKREWDANADWFSIITSIQSQLGSNYELDEDASIIPTGKLVQQAHPQDLRVKQVRRLINYPVELVREWLQLHDAKTPSQLPLAEIDQLVKDICLSWAADYIDPNHVCSSYQEQALGAIAAGTPEINAIQAWMNYVVGLKTPVGSP